MALKGNNCVKLRIKRVDLLNPSAADMQSMAKVLAGSANTSVFHSVEWNQLLTSEFGLRNVTLVAFLGDGPVGLYSYYELDGHRCVSPVTHLQSVYGGPISVGNDSQVIGGLLRASERLQGMAAFQVWTPPDYDLSAFVERGYSCRTMYTPVLDLQAAEEELWARLRWEKRNRIRRALKSGVVVEDGDLADLDVYYQMVVETLGRAGVGVLPKSFYKQILTHLAPRGMARLRLAKVSGEVIAGTVTLFYKD